MIPLLNLLVALVIAGLVVLIIGENPLEAMWIMLKGAVGSLKGWGYLLYYATNFIFTGLAVAVAFHAGLFNIGGEGQAYMAGAGAAAVGLGLEFLPWPIVIPLAILASMAVGAFWAWVPGVLQVKRGSHIVITTIMFNYIAAQPDGLSHQLLVPPRGQDGGRKPRDHRRLYHELPRNGHATSLMCACPQRR